MHDLLKPLIDWYLHSLESGGYLLIVLLMFIESTFLPLPSELIIPPAAHLAYTKGGMSLLGIVVAGALGSWLGATAMYWAARWAGRPLVLKVSTAIDSWAANRLASWPRTLQFVRHLFITPEKVEKAENWSASYGNFGIFASRMLPVVRHLIGIPAGIVRMTFWKFCLYTLAGSAFWCGVLTYVSVVAGKDERLMHGEIREITIWATAVAVVLGAAYYFLVHRLSHEEE